MKKPRAKEKKIQAKRARKAAKRKKVRKEKLKKHKEIIRIVNSMDEEELQEYLDDDYDNK